MRRWHWVLRESVECSSICFLPLLWTRWPTSVPVMLARAAAVHAAKCSSLLANPALSGDRVIYCNAPCGCTSFVLPSFLTRGRTEDPCVNTVCFEMLEVSLGFFHYCCESSLFWDCLSIFANWKSEFGKRVCKERMLLISILKSLRS